MSKRSRWIPHKKVDGKWEPLAFGEDKNELEASGVATKWFDKYDKKFISDVDEEQAEWDSYRDLTEWNGEVWQRSVEEYENLFEDGDDDSEVKLVE